MSKRFKGKTCVYCAVVGISETADHVFAREFLPVEHRDNLPKVPACKPCNGTKSELEHYLAAVLPFGGRHPASPSMLTEQVPRRLDANRRLQRELSEGRQHTWVTEKGVTQRTSTVPFKGEKLHELFAMVTRGLTAHHFGHVIPADHHVGAGSLARWVQPHLEAMLAMHGAQRVSCSIGAGLFLYEGVQGVDTPSLTIWRYRIYGGITLADTDQHGERSDTIWATSTRLASQSILTA
ncbi:hypothetical protein [Novosphingobium rosa]|uniref:hypothetical protein n=1 Tax=Novosphingobium rosa TaxID=76978 RepID=UPI00083663D0|nr:hypothetical protein [Novosphingobium rosa]